MQKKLLLGGLLLLGCGCESMSNTDKGLLTGGVLGAGLGTVIGGLTGHPGAGAAIGAGTGLLAGGLAGNAVDHKEARDARAAAAYAAQHPPLNLQDVVSMAQQHISDALIINQIRSTGSAYNLTANDITWLKQQGVSDQVVFEMQSRRPALVPVRPSTQVYVVEPAPPPVGVGIGIGYGCGRRW